MRHLTLAEALIIAETVEFMVADGVRKAVRIPRTMTESW